MKRVAQVFVGYPWAPYDRDAYKQCFRALESKHQVHFVFAEDRLTSEHLIAKIEGIMTAADFCIFDLTDLNFNVALEYGIARGLRLEAYIAFNPTVGTAEVPSDLRGIDSLRYKTLGELQARLDAFLAQATAPAEQHRRLASATPATRSEDETKFDEEAARIAETPLRSKIRTRGYWHIRIRPSRYEPGRVPYANLQTTIGASKVERGSWGFPHTDAMNQFPMLGDDWYGRDHDLGYFLESWRFFQSGLFDLILALPEDWQEEWSNKPTTEPNGTILMPRGAAPRILEAFEFAAGLAKALPGDDGVVMSIGALGMRDRILWAKMSHEEPFIEYDLANKRTAMEAFRHKATYARSALENTWEDSALKVAEELFQRFGWSPESPQLRRFAGLG